MERRNLVIHIPIVCCICVSLLPVLALAEERPNNTQYCKNISLDSLDIQFVNPYINPRRAKPLGVCIYGGSPALFVSVAVDYFVKPYLSLEVGGGAFGVYTGGRYHFRGNVASKNWTPYIGLLFAIYGEAVGVDNIFFLPVGIQYSGMDAFFFAFELSAMSQAGPAGIPLWAGLKLGFRF